MGTARVPGEWSTQDSMFGTIQELAGSAAWKVFMQKYSSGVGETASGIAKDIDEKGTPNGTLWSSWCQSKGKADGWDSSQRPLAGTRGFAPYHDGCQSPQPGHVLTLG